MSQPSGLCGPHRLLLPQDMQSEDVLNEQLFHNKQIVVPVSLSPATATSCNAQPLTPQHHPSLVTAGITKLAHLQAKLQLPQPQHVAASMRAVLLALPAAWRAVAQSAPLAPAWVHASTTASTHQMLLHPLTGQLHQVGADHRLQPVPAVAFTAMAPAQVVAWDPARPGGVQHISQHSQQLPYTPRASCGFQPTCHMGFGAGAHSQLISSLSNMPASACVSFRPLLPGILSALKA